MRSILLILTGLLLSMTSLPAQVMLSESGYPSSVLGADSLLVTTSASIFPSLLPMTNGIWDMSIVADSVPIFFAYRVPTVTYDFADSNQYNFGVYNYRGNVQSSITSGGIYGYGIDILKTGYSITPLTFGPNDSFIINTQSTSYSSQRTKIAFPATYNTSWSSLYRFDLGFQLTFLLAGDTLAPGIIRTYTTERDSVVGWGKMRIKDASGGPSDYQHVLQVQTIVTHIDSFFLKGVPVPALFLTTFNVAQGKKDTVYEQNYYRVGEVTALAQVEFKDSSFTRPYKATTHVQRLAPDFLSGIERGSPVKIFPNPVTDRSVNVQLPVGGGIWNYEIVNTSGQSVAAGLLPSAGNQTSAMIQVNASIVPGIYFLRIFNDMTEVLSQSVEIK